MGRSQGGLSTQINATVDALGNPMGFALTPGQACDLDGADVLLPLVEAQTVLADKGYDADDRVITPLLQAGKTVVIPPKRHRKIQRDYDKELYKSRHLIEPFFCTLKPFRAIATRYVDETQMWRRWPWPTKMRGGSGRCSRTTASSNQTTPRRRSGCGRTLH